MVKGKTDTIYSLDAVPLFKVGTWSGSKGAMTFSYDDLAKMKDNTDALLNAGIINAPATPGHEWTEDTGALGWLKRVFMIGDQLFGDFTDMTKEAYNKVMTRQYKGTSPVLRKGFIHPATKKPIDGYTITEVAFEGLQIPAVKGGGNIIYNSENFNDENIFSVCFSEQSLQEEKQMSVWTIKDVEAVWPCCVDNVKKFMETKKITEINQEDLAILMSELRIEKAKEKFAETITELKKQECPTGYEWNETKGVCVKVGTGTIEAAEQTVCPKGWAMNETTMKCEMVEVAKPVEPAKTEPVAPKFSEPVMTEPVVPVVPPILTDEEKAKVEADEKTKLDAMKIEAEKAQKILDDKAALDLKMSEEKRALETKTIELMAKVKELESKQMKQMFSEFKEKERDILIPALDPYLDSFYTYFSEKNDVVKFAEKDENTIDLFVKFLKSLANSKRVIFSELTKSHNTKDESNTEGVKMEQEIKFSEEQKVEAKKDWDGKYSEQLTESKFGITDIVNSDIAELASKISFSEKISICEAQIKAAKILKTKKGE